MRSKREQRRNTISRRKQGPTPQTPAYSRSVLKVSFMPLGPLPKITFPMAAEICQRYEPDEEALSCLQDGVTAVEFLESLAERGLWSEAVKFLAQASPNETRSLGRVSACVTSRRPIRHQHRLRLSTPWILGCPIPAKITVGPLKWLRIEPARELRPVVSLSEFSSAVVVWGQ